MRTFTLIFPNLLANDAANSIDMAAIRVVMKNIVPSFPSSSLNLSWKK